MKNKIRREANLACLTERKQQTTSVATAVFRSSFVQCDEKYLKKAVIDTHRNFTKKQ